MPKETGIKKLMLSRNAEKAAKQYLCHEFRKIFREARGEEFFRQMDDSIENMIFREDEASFWRLVAAISEGWKLKWVFHILSSTKYRWSLKPLPLESLTLTGMSPVMDNYNYKEAKGSPIEFARCWHEDKTMRKEIMDTGFARHPERDHFPIMVYQDEEGRYKVFDGMRRLLWKAIDGKDKVEAWAGKLVNPKGQSLISEERCFFLGNIFDWSDERDPELVKAVITIGRHIIRNYRNGGDVLANRIAGWSHDDELKRIFEEMIK